MALRATVLKADLSIADMDRNYYADHSLTLAQHPSETTERLMLRLAVFALHADEALAFGKGISTDDEPDMWQIAPNGEIERWIELGEPDEKRLRKACGRARQVWIYSYGGRAADIWWQQNGGRFARFDNLQVRSIDAASLPPLAELSARSMRLSATIQDGTLWLADGERNVELRPDILK